MATDTDRVVTIANELKSMDKRRQELLAELHRIAGGPGGNQVAKTAKPPTAARTSSRKRTGLTSAIMGLLQETGAAYTAGDIVRDLNLKKTTGQIASVSSTLGRLVKEGRLKKDEERGYLAG